MLTAQIVNNADSVSSFIKDTQNMPLITAISIIVPLNLLLLHLSPNAP